MDPSLLVIAAVFLAGGVVKGVTGMGLPTVVMGLLSTFLSPVTAASMLIVPSLVSNVAQVAQGGLRRPLLYRLRYMLAATVAATAAGTYLIASAVIPNSDMLLGLILVAYALLSLVGSPVSIPASLEAKLSPAVGVLTGIITGATGIFVIPAVPYLQALNLEKEELVQALGLSFTASTVGLWVGLVAHRALVLDDIAISVAAVLPALGGMRIGQAIRGRLNAVVFRRLFLISLLLLGAHMILR